MTIQLMYQGEIELCEQWTYQLQAIYHLYTNDITLSRATMLSDLIEATFPGYAPQEAHGWTPAVLRSGNAVTWADPLLFAATAAASPQTVYGYFVTRGNPARLVWAERRVQGPVSVVLGGDPVIVLPSLTLCP